MNRSSLQMRNTLPWLALWALAALALVWAIGPSNPAQNMGGLGALTHGVLAGRDTLTHDYPATWWGWSQVRATGNLPLWNPSWFCGEAFIASQTFMPFYPLNWLAAVLPFPLAFNIQYPLHLLLAAAVMGWAVRRRGLGWTAAGLAALSWGFGGHLATLAGPGHIQKLQTLAWLPMVALGASLIARGQVRRGLLPLGVGLALQVTAGHLQIVYLTLIVAMLEGLAGLVGTATVEERAKPTYVPFDFRGAGALMALALAVGLSAIFWVPTVEFAGLSNRQGALSWEDATRGSLPPEEMLEFALPRLRGDSMLHGRGEQLTGRPAGAFYLGRYGESSTSAPERVVSDYIGAGVLIFALYGFFAGGRRRMQAWGYGALALAILLLAMGRYLPWFYKPALTLVPGLSHFRSPSTMMALFAYGMVMAAALGAQEFFAGFCAGTDRTKNGRKLGAWMIALGVLTLGVALLSGSSLRGVAEAMVRLADPAEMRKSQLLWLRLAAMQHLFFGLGLVLAAAGGWAMVAGATAIRPALRRVGATLLLGALGLGWGWDLASNARPFWNAEAIAPYKQFLTTHWAMPQWAQSEEPVRYLEFGNELSNRALTLSNFKRGLSIGSASGYHPVAYKKYFEMLDKMGFTHPNFLRLFAINYLIWPEGIKAERPAGYLELDRMGNQLLLRNTDVAYVRPMRHLQAVPDQKALLDRISKPDFHVYESSTVTNDQLEDKKHHNRARRLDDMKLQTRIYVRAPGETQMRLSCLKRGLVIVSEPAVPGWRVWINGRNADRRLSVVDGFFLSILLEAGRNDVWLVYDPVSQRLGLYVTLLTLAGLSFITGRHLAGRRPIRNKEADV